MTPHHPSRPRVLVADDDADVRRMLSIALGQDGYEAVEAGDGRAALAAAEAGAFDVVLLDQHMPGLTGTEVLRRLRERRATLTTPVVLVTAAGELDHVLHAFDAGATDYVTKPFRVDEVLARVRAHLRHGDAWLEAVEEQLRERASVGRSLADAAALHSLEAKAAAICDRLGGLADVAGAAILLFPDDEVAVPLAVSGRAPWRLPPDGRAPLAVARYLRRRAADGPWLDPATRSDAPGARAAPGAPGGGGARRRDAPPPDGPVACVPLGDVRAPIGLLALVGAEGAGGMRPTALQAAAIDFGVLCFGLLRHDLETRLAADARRASVATLLTQGAFTPRFQPVVRMSDSAVVGAEALTRFADGSPPDRRFAEAARVGLGLDLELAALDRALRSAAALPEDCWLAVNMSPAVALHPEALTRLTGSSPRTIVLELTEHDPVDDYDELRAALDQVRPRVKLSVDDAGAGYASLRHILALDPDFVKLDRTWVHSIDTDPSRQALVAGLCQFGARTGSAMIAEGIERPEERAQLTELGVDLGQGFLLGRPGPADTVGGSAPSR